MRLLYYYEHYQFDIDEIRSVCRAELMQKEAEN